MVVVRHLRDNAEMWQDDLWTAHLAIERAREKLANLVSIRCAPQSEPRGYNKPGRRVKPKDLAPLTETFYRFEEEELWDSVNAMIELFEKEAQFLCGKCGMSYPQHLQERVKAYFQTEMEKNTSSPDTIETAQ